MGAMKQQILTALVNAFMTFKPAEDWIAPKADTIGSKASGIMQLEDDQYDENYAEAVGQIAHGVLAAVAEGLLGIIDQDVRKTASPEFAGMSLGGRPVYATPTYSATKNTGWYTIAYNSGDRASAVFFVRDTATGYHSSIHFIAQHLYRKNHIAVLSSSYYGTAGGAIRQIRLLSETTYGGAALQVYVASNNIPVQVWMDQNYQQSGWTLVNWSTDTYDLPEKTLVDLTSFTPGMATSGNFSVQGKLTAASIDPEYVHYEENTRAAITQKVQQDIPTEKLGGAVMFYNKEASQMEYFVPNKGEFRTLQNEVVGRVDPVLTGPGDEEEGGV